MVKEQELKVRTCPKEDKEMEAKENKATVKCCKPRI
jgi:hypothetical protein